MNGGVWKVLEVKVQARAEEVQVGAEEVQAGAEEVQLGADQFTGQNGRGGQAAGADRPAGARVLCEQISVTQKVG